MAGMFTDMGTSKKYKSGGFMTRFVPDMPVRMAVGSVEFAFGPIDEKLYGQLRKIYEELNDAYRETGNCAIGRFLACLIRADVDTDLAFRWQGLINTDLKRELYEAEYLPFLRTLQECGKMEQNR